jgi:hypothetical protein
MNHVWLVRPSEMGNLMASGRSKDQEWGDTAMKVIQKNVLLHKYDIDEPTITTKEMDKGITNEAKNLEIASRVLGWLDIDANAPKIRIANNYFIGEPDYNGSILVDIKSSFSALTFPFFGNPNNKSYEYQMQAYMDLTNKEEAELVYVLSNHPDHIVRAEIKRLTYYYVDRPHEFNMATSIDDLWAMAEEKATNIVMREANVEHIPEDKRVRRFTIKKDDNIIEAMHKRIEDARVIFDRLMDSI